MINNETESSTMTVTNQPDRSLTPENTTSMTSTNVSLSNLTGAEQTVQPKSDDQTEISTANNTDDQQILDEQESQADDEFIRITAAHQILTEAQTYDEQKNYSAALHLYRICVDLLLEELMFTEGTEQSRVYLREKCTAIMDHIDFLKTKLDPLPASTSTTENNESETNPPVDELNSLHLS